jgi:Tol biopolymer transport system component
VTPASVTNGVIAYTEFFGGLVSVEPPGSAASEDIRIEDPDAFEVSFLDWSPDGRRLTYVDGSYFERTSIVVLNVETGERSELTPGSIDASPVWSPDGRRIAFLRFSHGKADLWVMNADGSDEQLVAEPPDQDSWTPFVDPAVFPKPKRIDPRTVVRAIAWAPDSQRLAFAADPFGHSPTVQIVELDVEGAPVTIEGSYPSWSPDGTQICIARNGPNGVSLVLVAADGSEVAELTGESGVHTLPAWSPDGEQILYVSDEAGPAGKYELWLMTSDGSDARQLTTDATELEGQLPLDLYPSWSPDGTKIVFLDEIFGGGAVDEWVSIVDVGSGEAEIATRSESQWPAWQPISG